MSEVEICQLAYEGRGEIFTRKISASPDLAGKCDQSGRNPLHWAALGGHPNIVEFLLKQCSIDLDCRDESNWTPLMIAVSAGKEAVVRILLIKGAEVNAVNSTGQSPLHYAASKDRFEIAEMLLERGADPNIGDWVNNTSLHRAASKGHTKMTKLLLSYNADPNHQDSVGNGPLHLACEEERLEECKLLVEHGASLSIENKEEKRPRDLAPRTWGKNFLKPPEEDSEMIM